MTDVPSSSAAPLQPVKEAGQRTASQDGQQFSPSDEDVSLLDDPTHEGRRAKRSRMGEGLSPSSSSSASPSSSPPHVGSGPGVSSPSPSPSPSSAVSGAAQPGSAVDSSVSSASAPATTQKNWVPLYVKHDKLVKEGVDDHRNDAMVVQFLTDARLPAPVLIDPAQYRLSPKAKLHAVAAFLGRSNGLGIIPPKIPTFLLSPSTVSDASSRNAAQQEWVETLQALMRQRAPLIMREEHKPADSVVEEILDTLYQHLSMAAGLYSKEHLTAGWAPLLAMPSRIIKGPVSAQPPTGEKHFFYQIELHAPTPEIAFITSCVLRMYGRLRDIAPAVTQGVVAILQESSISGAASSTDSSDEDTDGFVQQRARQGSAKYKAKKREAEMQGKLSKFLQGPILVEAIPSDESDELSGLDFYKAFTLDPLRSLCTKVKIRPVYIPYVSFLIDGFDTLGCNIYDNDLSQDPVYQRVITCMPELQDGTAHWSVVRRIGGSGVSVWIREQHMEKVVQLNDHLRTVLGIATAALHIRHTVVPRLPGGRLNYKDAVNISLTPPSKPAPPATQAARPGCVTTIHSPSGMSGLPGSASGRYAACVLEGLKRSAASQNSSVDHRPHKEQRTTVSASAAHANAKVPAQSGGRPASPRPNRTR
jgi:hypothetical protein